MKIELRALAALASLCLSSVLIAADDEHPGGKRICVPSEDGRSWVCGTADAPPPERGLPTTRSESSAPEPPPFLADPSAGASATPSVDLSAPPPERPPPDRFEGSGREVPTTGETAAAAPIEEAAPVAPEPLVEEAPVDEPEIVAEPEPEPEPEASPTLDVVGADSAEEGTPAFIAAPVDQSGYQYSDPAAAAPAASEASAEEALADEAPAPEPEPEAAPVETVAAEPVVEEPVAPEPVVEEPVVAEPVVTESVPVEPAAVEPVAAEPIAPAPVEPEPALATTAPAAPEPTAVAPQSLATPPGNSAAFLLRVPTHYTLQIARATSQSGFSAQLGALSLRGEDAWAVPLSAGGTTTWMLLWGDFPDLESARSAAKQLRLSGWPRRMAPIQNELRGIGTR